MRYDYVACLVLTLEAEKLEYVFLEHPLRGQQGGEGGGQKISKNDHVHYIKNDHKGGGGVKKCRFFDHVVYG